MAVYMKHNRSIDKYNRVFATPVPGMRNVRSPRRDRDKQGPAGRLDNLAMRPEGDLRVTPIVAPIQQEPLGPEGATDCSHG